MLQQLQNDLVGRLDAGKRVRHPRPRADWRGVLGVPGNVPRFYFDKLALLGVHTVV